MEFSDNINYWVGFGVLRKDLLTIEVFSPLLAIPKDVTIAAAIHFIFYTKNGMSFMMNKRVFVEKLM